MSAATEMFHEHVRETQQPGPHNNDPWFCYQQSLLLEFLVRLELVLKDEGAGEALTGRILHRTLAALLPHPADAVLRVQQQEQLTEILKNVHAPTVLLGIDQMDPSVWPRG